MVPVYMEMRSDEKILQKQEKTLHLHYQQILTVFLYYCTNLPAFALYNFFVTFLPS